MYCMSLGWRNENTSRYASLDYQPQSLKLSCFGMQILPNGAVWLPSLVERIVEVATGDTKSIVVDKKLIDGPNANQRGKLWIPLVILAQVSHH